MIVYTLMSNNWLTDYDWQADQLTDNKYAGWMIGRMPLTFCQKHLHKQLVAWGDVNIGE